MSLPSILDYLPEEAPVLFKLAAEEPKRKPPITATPSVMRAGLRGALVMAGATGLGYGAGKLVGYGANALSKKLTGKTLNTKYAPIVLAAVGLLGGATEAMRMRKYKELLRDAYENPSNGTSRSTPRK